jgi:serine/threonine protein kinase
MTHASNASELPIGTFVADRYRIDSVLGVGGFGITYRAFDVSLERTVAIKELFSPGAWRDVSSLRVMTRDNNEHRTATSQFVLEGRALAKFSSPSIVRVHDSFEANSTAYLVMELLIGPTLEELVYRNGPLSHEQLIHVVRQLGGALEEVHRNGLVHQDVSPSNVIMTQDQRVAVLVDFGAARNVVAQRSHDLARIVKGGYSPLEQYSSGQTRDGKTDVYALGASMYFSATGVVPVDAPSRASGVSLPIPMQVNPLIAPGMSAAIESALSIGSASRPTLQAFVNQATGGYVRPNTAKTALLDSSATRSFQSSQTSNSTNPWPSQPRPKKKRGLVLAIGGVVVALSGVLVAILVQAPEKTTVEASSTASTTATPVDAAPNAPEIESATTASPSTSPSAPPIPQPETPSPAPREAATAPPTSATAAVPLTAPKITIVSPRSQAVTTTQVVATLPPSLATAPKESPSSASPIRSVEIGRSLRGRTITLATAGQGSPRVLIIGGLSGELEAGPSVTNAIVSMVAKSALSEQVTIGGVPDPNPDGRASNSRYNAKGVDLNRNFPASDFEPSPENGTRALSEPESQAVFDAIQTFRPTLVISLIGTARTPFTNFDGTGRSAAATFANASGYPLTPSDDIARTPGSLGGWVGVDNNVPVVVVAYRKSASSARAWADTEYAFKALLESL